MPWRRSWPTVSVTAKTEGVWFSQFLDCWGESGRHLLEIILDMPAEDLASHAVEAVADEVWDDDAGDFVKVEDDALIQRFVWYKIPASIVNARGRARHVPPGEVPTIFDD
jgi:hypothetical protein